MNEALRILVDMGFLSERDAQLIALSSDPDSVQQFAESVLTVAIARALENQRQRVEEWAVSLGVTAEGELWEEFWREENNRLATELLPTYIDLGHSIAFVFALESAVDIDYNALDNYVTDWIEEHYNSDDPNAYGAFAQINTTAAAAAAPLVNAWLDGDETALYDLFDPSRPNVIASTESTRLIGIATLVAGAAAIAAGMVGYDEWETAADEFVCPRCGPMHGRQTAIGATFGGYYPPLHPGCRCRVRRRSAP